MTDPALPVPWKTGSALPVRWKTGSALPVPWQPEQLVRLVVTDLVALVLLVIAWFNASNQLKLAAQIRPLDLAVVSLVVLGAGNVGWLLAGRRSVGLRSRDLHDRLAARSLPVPSQQVATQAAMTEALTVVDLLPVGALLQVPGMSRTHLAGCPLLAGKTPVRVAAGSGERCGICQ